MTAAPPRLLDGAPLGAELEAQLVAELRADLSALRDFTPDYDVTSGAARLQLALAAAAAPQFHHEPTDALDPVDAPVQSGPRASASPPSPAGSAAGSLAHPSLPATTLTGGKLAGMLVLGIGLGWGALTLTPQPTAPRAAAAASTPRASHTAPRGVAAAPARATSSPAAPALEAPPSAPSAPATAERLPSSARARTPAPATANPRVASRAQLSSSTLPSSPAPAAANAPAIVAPLDPYAELGPAPREALLKQEVAQLAQVRRQLSAAPQRALELANEGHHTFAEGALHQEREALALRALARLQKTAELRSRGLAFLRAYPQSSFAPQVRSMLGL